MPQERLVLAAGLAFAAIVLTATAIHIWQLGDTLRRELDGQQRTLARILAKELDRDLGSVRSGLAAAAEAAAAPSTLADEAAAREPILRQLVRDTPLLRELALLDGRGRVIASASGRLSGDLSGYDFARGGSPTQRERIGSASAGRTPGIDRNGRQGAAYARDGFFTAYRIVDAPAPLGTRTLVAVIGSDSLINELDAVAGGGVTLSVFSYDGLLLATSDTGVPSAPHLHPIFRDFLPAREIGSFEEQRDDATRWMGAFHTAAEHPVVVEVRTPASQLTARWRDELAIPLAIALAMLAAVGLLGWLAARALRLRARSAREAALQERRLRDILETAADGIVTIDSRGIVREFNRAAEAIFECPAHDAIGRPLADLIPAAHGGPKHQMWVERYLAGESSSVIGRGRTIRSRRRDGSPLEIHLAVSELIFQGEHLFTGIVRDVTEVRQAEQRFRTLFERSGEPLMLFDPSGLLDCNASALALLGAAQREDVLGRRIEALAPAPGAREGAPAWTDLLEQARRDGVHRIEWSVLAASGEPRPVEMTVTPIRLSGQEAVLVSLHDISERRRHEAELTAARDAAESAAQAKASFLAMMSHELRTPMTGIIGMTDLLGDTALSHEQTELVSVLRNSAQSLLTVLNDILDFSKIEAGKLTLESLEFSASALAAEVVALLATAASARGNALVSDWEAGDVPRITGDPTRLRQVLFNLVGNAIKFTERGTITVGIRCIPAPADATHEPKVTLRFTITDTGVGIGADVLPTLFTPFQQADSSTTRRFGGTGLGLAICRHLVRAMGGEIGVDSTPGVGSTFWFDVALALAAQVEPDGSAPAAARHAPPRAARRPLKILVAEDNPTNQLLISTRLKRSGHLVSVAANGVQAVEAVEREAFDVVLMDMQMPELDGPGATREIRRLPPPRCDVPVIALTADALPEFRERYMSSGLDDYLTKPIDWTQLFEAIERNLGRPGRSLPTASHAAQSPRTSAPSGKPPSPPPNPPLSLLPSPPPDVAAVAARRAEFGDDVHAHALEIYWSSSEVDVAGCEQAVAAADQPRRRALAHALKGASATVGFESVAAAAARLEHCAPAEAGQACERMRAAFDAARAAWGVPDGADHATKADSAPAELVD